MDIPEELIEAAAAAMWRVSPKGWRGIGEPPPFDQASPRVQESYRLLARTALEATTEGVRPNPLADRLDRLASDWARYEIFEYGGPSPSFYVDALRKAVRDVEDQ